MKTQSRLLYLFKRIRVKIQTDSQTEKQTQTILIPVTVHTVVFFFKFNCFVGTEGNFFNLI